MSDKLRFKKMGNWDYVESENFIFSKYELIEFFKSYKVIDGNVFKKIENHELVSVTNTKHTGYKYHFYPSEDSDEYMLSMTKPIDQEPMIYHKLMSFLLEKESQDLDTNNDTPWIETWHLKP